MSKLQSKMGVGTIYLSCHNRVFPLLHLSPSGNPHLGVLIYLVQIKEVGVGISWLHIFKY
jgi:hypothetical protein